LKFIRIFAVMKKGILVFVLSIVVQVVSAQVFSARLMTYNVLNYRNSTNECNGNTNSASAKEARLDTILSYAQPHIIVFNEVGASANNAQYLLNNVLNSGGGSSWSTTNYTNNSFSSLTKVIAYRNDLFGVLQQDVITQDLSGTALVRVVDAVRFYYKDPLLTAQSDTVTFTVIGAHFKAGNGTSNSSVRNLMAKAVIDYIDNDCPDDNVFLLGDYNMYSSSESAYQSLVAGQTFRFDDPIGSGGNWNNNSSFASVHTQSTRSSSSNSCFSAGGLDDRFDQILCSEDVLDGEDGMVYVPNTYLALGNDGAHFNSSINSGTNFSVSANVLSALYNLSDHLPVVADFEIDQQSLETAEWSLPKMPNPLRQPFSFQGYHKEWSLALYNLHGRLVFEKNAGAEKVLDGLPKGMYTAVWTKNGRVKPAKLMVW
jgi:hypothetical protein